MTIEGDTDERLRTGRSRDPARTDRLHRRHGRFVPGFSVHAGAGTRIEGLAIGGFGSGIEIGPTEGAAPHGTEICGDYLGTERDGETAEPNEVGIQINVGDGASEGVEGTMIGGAGCAAKRDLRQQRPGDLRRRQGNDDRRQPDRDRPAKAAAGRSPTGPKGTPNRRGSTSTPIASGTVIGSPTGAINLIWNNNGPGVLVENAASPVTIRHNSFFDNEGKGIEIAEGAPAAPVITIGGVAARRAA